MSSTHVDLRSWKAEVWSHLEEADPSVKAEYGRLLGRLIKALEHHRRGYRQGAEKLKLAKRDLSSFFEAHLKTGWERHLRAKLFIETMN